MVGGNSASARRCLVQAFLDSLGDLDLALARQQVDGAHFAHVHAHRIRGASELAVEGGECGGRLFLRVVVVDGLVHQQQGVRIGRHLVHGDPHVVDHADDVFDLLGVDDALGEVVVDLVVGEVTLLLTLGDQ